MTRPNHIYMKDIGDIGVGDTPLSMLEEDTSFLDVNSSLLEKNLGHFETQISTTIAKE